VPRVVPPAVSLVGVSVTPSKQPLSVEWTNYLNADSRDVVLVSFGTSSQVEPTFRTRFATLFAAFPQYRFCLFAWLFLLMLQNEDSFGK
jgi:hypothetical protein